MSVLTFPGPIRSLPFSRLMKPGQPLNMALPELTIPGEAAPWLRWTTGALDALQAALDQRGPGGAEITPAEALQLALDLVGSAINAASAPPAEQTDDEAADAAEALPAAAADLVAQVMEHDVFNVWPEEARAVFDVLAVVLDPEGPRGPGGRLLTAEETGQLLAAIANALWARLNPGSGWRQDRKMTRPVRKAWRRAVKGGNVAVVIELEQPEEGSEDAEALAKLTDGLPEGGALAHVLRAGFAERFDGAGVCVVGGRLALFALPADTEGALELLLLPNVAMVNTGRTPT